MLVCMKCHQEFEDGTLYCSNCGGDLVTKEEPKPVKQDTKKGGGVKPDGKLVCPKCHILYEKLTSCIRCGTPLVTQSALREMKESLPPPAAPESKKTESKVAPPSEVKKEPSPILSPKKPPVEPRKGEPRQPYAADIMQEPSSLEAAGKTPEKELPEDKRERTPHPKKGKGNILQSRIGILFLILLVIAAIYFLLNPISGERIGLWPKSSKKATGSQKGENSTLSKEAAPAIPTTAIPVVLLPQEVNRILDVLENIRQANLKKNINLLMSCYASDFKNLEETRRTALEFWSKHNYLDLAYVLKVQSVSIDSAKARVEWHIRSIPLAGGESEEGKSALNVVFQKEKNKWKIKEVAQVK